MNNSILKTKPYRHQKKAIRKGLRKDQFALLMEQGTGKTLAAIGIAGHRFVDFNQIEKLLIISPLSVVPVWHTEFMKHAEFPYILTDLTHQKDEQRKINLALMGHDRLKVALINYESAWRCLDIITKWKPDMVIIDESQKIKNGRAKQSKAIHKLGDMVRYKMILSGTPITQGPLDVWSQYRFLDSRIFGTRYVSFRDRYAVMMGLKGHPGVFLVKNYRRLDELTEKAHSIAYRVTKDKALDLPETVDQEIMVSLSKDTQKIYDEMEKHFMVQFSETEISTAPIILTQLLRLQQITGGFLPTEDGEVKSFDSAKLNAVREILTDLPNHKKVVIFARFTSEVEALRDLSKKLGRNPVTLSGATKNRGAVVKKFQEDSSVKDIIIQIQTGGLGITLTEADTAIFYSTTFSYADYDQAKARLHRIGQRNPVTYIHILAEDTIDSDVLDILKHKGDIASQIVDRIRKKS